MSDTSWYPQTRQPNSRGFYGFGSAFGDPLGVDPSLDVAMPSLLDTSDAGTNGSLLNSGNYNLGVPTSQLIALPIGLSPKIVASNAPSSSTNTSNVFGLAAVGLAMAGALYYFKRKG